MASFARPAYVDQGIQRFGSGIFSCDYRVLEVDMHSDSFFKGSNKRVPGDEDYAKSAHRFAATLPVIDESTLVRTSDGVNLVWFTKRGMFSPYDPVWRVFNDLSIAAIRTLLQSFPPPTELGKDQRHRNHLKKEKSSWAAKGCQYGVYVCILTPSSQQPLADIGQHFVYWYVKYHNNSNWSPIVSADACPKAPKAMGALVDYISDTTWEHRLISGWFKALDPYKWEEYHSRYQQLRNEGELRHLDSGAKDWGCFLGHALLINAYVDPHKDSHDVKRGWVITYPWMDFEGGDAVYLDLALRFKQRAGDFIMSRSCVLSHMTMPITAGQRWGNTWFTKANILERPIANIFCDEPGCTSSYTSPAGLQWHKSKDHSEEKS